MSSRTLWASACIAAATLVWNSATWAGNLAVTPARTMVIVLDGTLGPVLSGSDPAGLDGQSATVTINVKESLDPYKTTRNSASYHIRAGDVTVTISGTNYTSTSRSSVIVKLGKKADLLTLKGKVTVFGHQVQISDVSALAAGSWTTDVLQHPTLFSPSPQNLSEPSSTFTYTVSGQTTVLGVTGTASNSE
jgi:hypothetical protein